jgi:2'-5' RNA ligase
MLCTPENWIPHITLARGDINNCNLGCLMDELAFQDLSWELEMDHIAVIGQDDEQVDQDLVYTFNA